jgi:hypothetical protein
MMIWSREDVVQKKAGSKLSRRGHSLKINMPRREKEGDSPRDAILEK